MRPSKKALGGIFAAALFAAVLFGAGLRLVIRVPGQQALTTLHRDLFPKIAYDQAFFDEAFASAAANPAPKMEASVLIINHHLLAKSLMARAVSAVARQPKRVVVLSPDHFGANRSAVISIASADFDTVYGVVETDLDLARAIVRQSDSAQLADAPVYREHGIQNVMPFIKKAWPEAKVTAMMIRPDTENVDQTARALAAELGPDDLLLVSEDFSHYLTQAATDFHDDTSLSILRSAEPPVGAGPDVDCPACLRLAMSYAKLRGTQKFVLLDHSDATRMGAGADAEEGTSYINGAYAAGGPEPDHVVTALVLPIGIFGSDAGDFLRQIDPRREVRLFYGQDVLQGWIGAGDPRMEKLFGAVPVWSDVASTSEVRGETVTRIWDEASRTVGVRCPNGVEVTYLSGSEEPSAKSVSNEPGAFAFTAAGGLLLTDLTPAVALGVTCSPQEAIVRPLLLEHVEGTIKLASPADTRVYLEQHYGITQDIIHVSKK